jgi:hypothetical protein
MVVVSDGEEPEVERAVAAHRVTISRGGAGGEPTAQGRILRPAFTLPLPWPSTTAWTSTR